MLSNESMNELLISHLSNENEIIRGGITNTFKNLLVDDTFPEKLFKIKIHDYYFSRIAKEKKKFIRKSSLNFLFNISC
jgi:hypothetical protein